MRELFFQFNTKLEFSNAVRWHDYILRCIPLETPEQQLLSFSLDIEPSTGNGSFAVDSFGNRTYAGRISGKHSIFHYGIRGRLRRDDSKKVACQPMSCMKFPSVLTKPTAEIKTFAAELQKKKLAGLITNREKGQAISAAVHNYFEYTPGVTKVETTAGEAFNQRKGVCQDFAQVSIAVARFLGMPARYVCGLPEGEGVSHAWFEVWDEGIWYGFDPTRNRVVDETYITLSTGRDYRDCPVERGLFRGMADQTQTVFMQVSEESI